MNDIDKEHVKELKKTSKAFAKIVPIIVAADGKTIVEGFHREATEKETGEEWPRYVNPELDTPVKIAIAQLIANTHRRIPPEEEITEKLAIIAEAEIAEKGEVGVIDRIADKLGRSVRWVQHYIPEKYKDMTMALHKAKTDEDLEEDIEIMKRLDSGETYASIRDAFGCGNSRITRLKRKLEEEGLPKPTPVEAASKVVDKGVPKGYGSTDIDDYDFETDERDSKPQRSPTRTTVDSARAATAPDDEEEDAISSTFTLAEQEANIEFEKAVENYLKKIAVLEKDQPDGLCRQSIYIRGWIERFYATRPFTIFGEDTLLKTE